MKKLFSMLLCFSLLATCFVSCSGEGGQGGGTPITQQELIGTWEVNVSLADGNFGKLLQALSAAGLEEQLSSLPQGTMGTNTSAMDPAKVLAALSDFQTSASMRATMTFGPSEYTTVMDEASFAQFFSTIMSDLFAYLKNGGVYKLVEAAGMTREQLDAQMAESGMTVEQYVDFMAVMMPSADKLLEQMKAADPEGNAFNTTASYVFENGVFRTVSSSMDQDTQTTAMRVLSNGQGMCTVELEHPNQPGTFIPIPGYTMRKIG